MSLIDGNIKEILSIKLKHRHDSITDQFNRIVMVKMLVIFSIIMSMEFFSDKVSCIVPFEAYMGDEFVHSACWIRGFYIYKELLNRSIDSSYYGIPKDVEIDGINEHDVLCRRVSKITNILNSNCQPLTKLYFIHYQYFPFYIASLAILFHLPYLLFRIINSDMINLNTAVKEASNDQDTINIADLYFKYQNNGGVFVLRLKVFATMGIKFLYVIVSVCGFLFTDHLLNNRYIGHGVNWLKWSQLNNSHAYDHSSVRGYPKPGNFLLPSMGFCDITEGSNDVRKTTYNDYRILCEISTHIIYQYVLFVLWFLFVTSITLSFTGLLHYTWRSIYAALFDQMCKSFSRRQPYLYRFTVREIEYLEFIRVKHIALYKDIMARFEIDPTMNPDGYLLNPSVKVSIS